MRVRRWKDIKEQALTQERLEASRRRARAKLLDLDLQELRSLSGMSQMDIADRAGMSQSQLSQLENRDDHLVSTLRRIVEAMGGELEVRAVFGDKAVRLHGV
jgi:DNA-binding XRE family transcriptional regulator